jgi:hypothetical protein
MSKITSTRARRTLPLLGAFVLAVFLPAPPARAADRRAILNLGLLEAGPPICRRQSTISRAGPTRSG